MIWFEAEQIATYLHNLELKLDEWSLSSLEMRIEKAELARLQRQLGHRVSEGSLKAEYVSQLSNRIKSIQDCLTERLKR